MTRLPAILGGDPIFPEPVPFARPTTEDPGRILRMVEETLTSGQLTDGPLARRLEERVEEAFGVSHCVAVSSCTIGLILVVQAVVPEGRVLVPSFTFSATAHAVSWNRAQITFADCRPDTWCLGPEHLSAGVGLVVGVHVSGVPCDVAGLEGRTAELAVPLIFDAAHAAGSRVPWDGSQRPLGGFGLAEVFSLTPTKVLSGAEGGLVTTDDDSLAEHLRQARNYGNPGDYDTRFPGLNARLSELHASVALASLDHLEERVRSRNLRATRYHQALGDIPGIAFQAVPPDARSSYKDLTILIDGSRFGASRDAVRAALEAEGIRTRAYYAPPVHHQTAYRDLPTPSLPITERLASEVISLPMWSHLPLEDIDRIGEGMRSIHGRAEEIEERAEG